MTQLDTNAKMALLEAELKLKSEQLGILGNCLGNIKNDTRNQKRVRVAAEDALDEYESLLNNIANLYVNSVDALLEETVRANPSRINYEVTATKLQADGEEDYMVTITPSLERAKKMIGTYVLYECVDINIVSVDFEDDTNEETPVDVDGVEFTVEETAPKNSSLN